MFKVSSLHSYPVYLSFASSLSNRLHLLHLQKLLLLPAFAPHFFSPESFLDLFHETWLDGREAKEAISTWEKRRRKKDRLNELMNDANKWAFCWLLSIACAFAFLIVQFCCQIKVWKDAWSQSIIWLLQMLNDDKNQGKINRFSVAISLILKVMWHQLHEKKEGLPSDREQMIDSYLHDQGIS